MKKSNLQLSAPAEVLKGVKFGGRFLYAVSTTTLSSLAITCSVLDDRCVAISDLYLQWRLNGIRVSMIARETTMCHLGLLFDGWTGSNITTTEEMCDLPFYSHGSGLFGSPLPSIYVSRKQLDALRQVKYYNTQLTGEDAGWEYQLTVFSYAPFATLNHDILIEYDMEFSSSADPTQTLDMTWKQRQKIARSKLSFGIVWPERKAETKEEGDVLTLSDSESVDAAKCLPNSIAVTGLVRTNQAGRGGQHAVVRNSSSTPSGRSRK